MDGRDLEKLRDAFVAAYDFGDLQELLRFKLDRRLDDIIAPNASFRSAVFQLLTRAEKEGWLVELLTHAEADRAGNAVFASVCRSALKILLTSENLGRLVGSYLCCTSNRGQRDEQMGELMHSRGMPVEMKEAKRFRRAYALWEWTYDSCGHPKAAHLIYGPYTDDDMREPGRYQVVFHIRGVGLPSNAGYQDDPVLLRVDVANHTELPSSLDAILSGPEPRVGDDYYEVTFNQLSRGNGGWQQFGVEVDSDGRGVWEYRVLVMDGTHSLGGDAMARFPGARLLFDKVEVLRLA